MVAGGAGRGGGEILFGHSEKAHVIRVQFMFRLQCARRETGKLADGLRIGRPPGSQRQGACETCQVMRILNDVPLERGARQRPVGQATVERHVAHGGAKRCRFRQNACHETHGPNLSLRENDASARGPARPTTHLHGEWPR